MRFYFALLLVFFLFFRTFVPMKEKEEVLRKLDITLNAMQEQAYQAISEETGDVVILSPTGSGKTLAYLLPLCEQLDDLSDNVQALVVVPGRELALQSDTVLKRMGTGLRSQSCYGGRAAMDEHRKLKDIKPQIVFGTPGRLNDHLQKLNISPYQVRWLVIDEFDKCLEMGFLAEMERLMKSLPGVKRRILLSATDAEELPSFVRLNQLKRIDCLTCEPPTEERISLYEVYSPQKDKLDTLRQLLLSLGDESSIVFLNYRDAVERVNDYLKEQGFITSYMHGGLEQRQREAALYRFSNGSVNVLVATDLASRGLDIPDVANIIHYHLPESESGYIHRVGRTARWDKLGRTFFILGPGEEVPSSSLEGGNLPTEFTLPEGEELVVKPPKMTTLYIGKGKKDKISRGDIVGFLCKKGGLTPQQIGRIDVNDRYSYAAISREMLRQVLRQVQGEKIKGLKTIVEEVR